jgi:hypothetical protein
MNAPSLLPRNTSRRIALLSAALVVCTPLSRGDWLSFLFHHDVEVNVTTDTTPEGALLRTPSKEEPVYYLAVSMGYRDAGGFIAGDKIPNQEAMHRFIAKALAKQGYFPATDQHPPSQLIIFAWGSLYVQRVPRSGNPSWLDFQTNRSQMLRFLGGEKLGLISKNPMAVDYEFVPGLQYMKPDAERISFAASDDLYMTVLSSYDLKALARKERHLLWRTRIACPSVGLVMADTLPTMLSIATPHIARETATPLWIRASDKYKPVVTVGDPVLEEYLDSGPLPIIDRSKAPIVRSQAPRKK